MIKETEIKGLDQTLQDYNTDPNAVRIYLDKSTMEVWYHAFASLNEWVEYHDNNIVTVCGRSDLMPGKLSKVDLLQMIDDELNDRFAAWL